MNLHRVALYLAGKLPPYYKEPFDKLELIELIKKFSKKDYSDLLLLTNADDFYSMALNKVQRSDEKALKKLLKKLNIDEDAGGLSKEDEIGDELRILIKEYEEMKKMGIIKGDYQKRGYKFEKWLIKLFNLFGLKPRASYRTDLDQIDGSFELDGKEYLMEAKWTKEESDTNVGDKMFARLNRGLISTVGLIISYSGFTSEAKKAAKGYKNILLMSGNDINNILNGEIELGTLIRSIRRRMAEEGNPYLG